MLEHKQTQIQPLQQRQNLLEAQKVDIPFPFKSLPRPCCIKSLLFFLIKGNKDISQRQRHLEDALRKG